jgi:outer membrane lipoprotein-sorting protein
MLRKTIIMVLSLFVVVVVPASGQTVDEIIAKNIEARGGMEKIKAVKSLRMTGKMMAQGQEMPFSVEMERPSNVRVEFTVQGKTTIQAYDGETGWMVAPFLGSDEPEKVTGDDLKDLEEQADMDGTLVDYKAKGHTVELMGKELLQGTEVYKLKITLKNGNIRYIYIGKENNLELKTSSTQKRQGEEFQIDAFLGNYKSVDGLMVPYAVDQKVRDQTVSSFTVDKVELNIDLDDSIFKMPPKKIETQTSPSDSKLHMGTGMIN